MQTIQKRHAFDPVPILPDLDEEFDLEPARSREPRRTANVLVDVLRRHGVDTVFGIPGGAIAPIYDALMDRPDIRVITTKHEASAMFAAAGYARTSGRIGVVLVTSGPGILNALTGLASAYCDGLPVLLLAGEVSRKVMGKGALQEGSAYHLDIVGMAKRISKFAQQINEPNAAAATLHRALATSMSGRKGPVTVTLPIDVASAQVVEPEFSLGASTTFELDPRTVRRAARILEGAKRPLIFAGSGLRWGAATTRLLEVSEQLGCPVMTTPKAKGVFPENHPLSLGVFGIGGHPSATAYLREGIDVLLAIGTSLGELSTNGWSPLLSPSAELIHVDIDGNQIGRNYPVTVSVTAPADLFLRQLRGLLSGTPRADAEFGVEYYTNPEVVSQSAASITPERALWEIQEVLARDTIYACDVGEHSVFATHYLETRDPDAFILMNGLGSMGQSIGAAMGAQLAQPERSIAVICGDGCFAMTATEIATAVAERLPITIFVFNDQRLGMVELGLSALYGRNSVYPTTPMDVAAVAKGLGAVSFVAEKAGDILKGGIPELRKQGPVVVDVRIDRDSRMPKHGRFEALGNVVKGRA